MAPNPGMTVCAVGAPARPHTKDFGVGVDKMALELLKKLNEMES